MDLHAAVLEITDVKRVYNWACETSHFEINNLLCWAYGGIKILKVAPVDADGRMTAANHGKQCLWIGVVLNTLLTAGGNLHLPHVEYCIWSTDLHALLLQPGVSFSRQVTHQSDIRQWSFFYSILNLYTCVKVLFNTGRKYNYTLLITSRLRSNKHPAFTVFLLEQMF